MRRPPPEDGSTRAGNSQLGPPAFAYESEMEREDFNAPAFIRERLQGVRMGAEQRRLGGLRAEVGRLHAHYAQQLNANVFQNYRQFIDTAREISQVERGVALLSSQLSEQRSQLEQLIAACGGDDRTSLSSALSNSMATAPGGSTGSGSATAAAAALSAQQLLHRMDGCADIVAQMKGNERVIFIGEMERVESETRASLGRALLALLTDKLLVGAQQANGKFSLETWWPLSQLAAVNVRDRDAHDLIKLLVFPEQRYYRVDSARAKKQWLEEVEAAKRRLLQQGSLVRQATIRGKRQSVQQRAAAAAAAAAQTSSTRNSASRPTGVLSEHDEQGLAAENGNSQLNEDEAAWLAELPAEIDDCIAHRDLEAAVEHIKDWQALGRRDATIDAQLQLRAQQVIQLLADDVRRPGAVHGGPRAIKKARVLLAQLGKGVWAVELYLRRRSQLLRAELKSVPAAEEPLSYVRRATAILQTALLDVALEFQAQPAHFSQVLQWCSAELSVLLTLIRRNVIETSPTLRVVSHSWRFLQELCAELAAAGLELTFQVERLLAPPIVQTLEDQSSALLKSLSARNSEEDWSPHVAESEGALNRLLEEMADCGLPLDWALSGDAALLVTTATVENARRALTLAKDLAPLRESARLCDHADAAVLSLWRKWLQGLVGAHPNGAKALECHSYSAAYVVSQVLRLCERTFLDVDEEEVAEMAKHELILTKLLQDEFTQLLKFTQSSGLAKGDEDDGDEDGKDLGDEEEVAHC